jgi:hypothetical protein
MNGFSFPNENEIKNEKDEQLNKRIKEYKEIYNNNNINYYNDNNNINNINNAMTNLNIPSQENIKLAEIEYEYDNYISNLKLKLNQEREERKKKEEEFVLIQHRLIKLKNQEKSKILQLKNVKEHIDKIINNRIKSQEKLNEKLNEKRNIYKLNNTNSSFAGMTNSNYYNKSMSKSQNNFCNLKLKNHELKKDEQKNNKKDFKQTLLEKIKKDEEEKKRIEEEIAKIEEEENNLLNQLLNTKSNKE